MHELNRIGRVLTEVFAVAILASCTGSGQGSTGDESADGPVVASAQDAGEQLTACLSALGWDVEASSDGSVSASYPTTQSEQYDADMQACDAQLNYREWDENDYATAYNGLIESSDCLGNAGYPVPDEVPSLQRFAEERSGQSSGDIWDPYALIALEELPGALSKCPQPDPIY